jgi:hypothetical protein
VVPKFIDDLPDIAFGAQTALAYSENTAATGGTLTLTDGRHAASIALLGNYMAGSFATTAGGHGAALISGTPQTDQQPLLTHPPQGDGPRLGADRQEKVLRALQAHPL